jgi:hypothetical protein
MKCHKCEKRHPGCHGTCSDYKEYREKLDQTNEVKRKESVAAYFVNRYCPSKNNYRVNELKR